MTLATVIAAIIVIALMAYAVTGGADFGAGIWDLLATGPRRDAQREQIREAIAPIWEANHVWLIIVIVLLFTCFPRAFSDLSVVLHVPLTLMLVGIVLRGSAFVFRAYGSARSSAQARWGHVFALASTITPVLLGVCIGAIASGRVTPALVTMDQLANGGTASFLDLAVRPWATMFDLAVGLLTLTAFAWLAAVYLCAESTDAALRDDFRRRALWCTAVLVLLLADVLLDARNAAPALFAGMTHSTWSLPYLAATIAIGLLTVWSLVERRVMLARLAAPANVALILGGWALAQYPYLIPARLAIADAAAPARTLQLALIALIVGSVVLLPSLAYLLRVFKGERAATGR